MFKKLAMGALTLVIAALPLKAAFAETLPVNLIANPSMETAASATAPANWASNDSGAAPTAAFTYENTGHTGTRSVKTTIPGSPTGDSKWYFDAVAVTPGASYSYSNWYISNIPSEIDAEVTYTDATPTSYHNLGGIAESSTWAKAEVQFTAPLNAKTITFFQTALNNQVVVNGFVQVDDASLTVYTPTAFNRAMVSVTFDDGWANQYQNLMPAGMVGTYYIISDEVTNADSGSDYMTGDQVKALHAAGNEIGSHSVHHCDLTGVQSDSPENCPTPISAAQVTSELANSKTTLETLIGAPVTNFAYPYGANNTATRAEGKQYYASQRTVTAGYNTLDNLGDATQLKMYEVDSNISQAQVKAWIDGAIAQKAWLILCYHEIATTPTDPSNALYTTQPTDFNAEMAYLKGTGVAIPTVAQALHEAQNQGTVTPVPTTPTIPVGVKPGDVNGDSRIDALDLSSVLSHWMKTGAVRADGDVNADGKVDALDLSLILSNWGK